MEGKGRGAAGRRDPHLLAIAELPAAKTNLGDVAAVVEADGREGHDEDVTEEGGWAVEERAAVTSDGPAHTSTTFGLRRELAIGKCIPPPDALDGTGRQAQTELIFHRKRQS